MQTQIRRAPTHVAEPPLSPREGSESSPRPPRHRLAWIGAIGVLFVLAGSVWRWRMAGNEDQAAKQERATVRVAKVGSGTFEITLRLSGATGAERYVSLNTPQLHGRRSDFTLAEYGSGVNTNKTVASNDTGAGGSRSTDTSSSSASASSTSGSSSGSTTSSTSSSSSTSASGSSASSSLTSRFASTSSRGTSSRSTAVSASSASSTDSSTTAMGASGLGSTSSSIPGTGSGSGITGDFTTVLQKLVKPGSRVRRQDVVAEFDRQYMITRLEDYRANVAQAEASFRKMKAELAVEWDAHEQSIVSAKAAWDKAILDLKTLPVQSAIAAETYKLAATQAEANYKELRAESSHLRAREQAQIRNAEIELQQAHSELHRSEANVDRMVIKAPIDGIAVMQPIFRGGEFSTIDEGDQLYPGQLFMQVVDTNSMVVNATANQVDAERIRLGARARIRFDAYPDLELPARVDSVGALGKVGRYRSSFVSEVPIRLRLERLDPRVIPDLSVSVDVILSAEPDATLAPLESIFTDSRSGEPFALVRNAGGWERRPIALGPANNLVAAVRRGLRPGETVAAEWPPGAGKR